MRRKIEAETSGIGARCFKIKWLWVLFGALWFTGVVIGIIVLRHHIADLEQFGYLGAFLISLLASATVVFMVPSVPVVFALGGILNPFFVAIAAAAGETLGESTAYLAGRTGSAFIFRNNPQEECGQPTGIYARLQALMRAKGVLALFISSAMFNPFMSVIGATAGALRMKPWKFYLVVFAGKTVKWTLVAMLAQVVLKYVLDWFGINLF